MHVEIFKGIVGDISKEVILDDKIKNTIVYIVELFEKNCLNAVEVSIITEILSKRSKHLLKEILTSLSSTEKEFEVKEPIRTYEPDWRDSAPANIDQLSHLIQKKPKKRGRKKKKS